MRWTSRLPSSISVIAARIVAIAASAPPSTDLPAFSIGVVLPARRFGRLSRNCSTLFDPLACLIDPPMIGRSSSCFTTWGRSLLRWLASRAAGGPNRASSSRRASRKPARTMPTATERRPTRPSRRETNGSRARASKVPTPIHVRGRPAACTSAVKATRTTKAPSSQATVRQSRSARITRSSSGTPVRYVSMAAPPRTAVLRLTPISIVRAVVMLGLTLGAIGVIASSARVIGWLLAAAALAGLLHPAVERLAHHVPRAIALAIVVLVTLGIAAAVGYAVIDDLVRQLHQLQHAVPSAARDLERSKSRVGEAARQVNLADRAKTFVDELPSRLRGGDVQQALRSAATRGVAFLATTVLTIFFLIHG